MSGDWMKVQLDTPDKPEVQRMAGMLGIDPDAVVGKLIRVWAWFDKHTANGHAEGVTYSLLDRITCHAGFSEAMALVGWLHQDGHILSLPNFDRHNGKTAKNRALSSNRQAAKRANVTQTITQESRSHRDASVTREEKRREDKKEDKQGAVALVTADALIADGLPSDLANELLQSRKRHRAPLTPRAWDGIKREARTAGLSPAEAVQKMIERGWRGFEAGWLSDGGQKAAPRPIEQRTYTPEELGL